MSNIVVQPVQNHAIIRATEIAERLDLPLATQADVGQQFVLEVSVEGLAIRDRRQVRTLPVQVVCSNLRRPSRGRDLLARAIGRTNKTVIDATAGFGDRQFAAAIDGRHAATVVAPVFESPQPFDQKLRCLAMSDVSYNSTHSERLWLTACITFVFALDSAAFRLLAMLTRSQNRWGRPYSYLTPPEGKVCRRRFDLSRPQRIHYIIILLLVILCDEMVVFSGSRLAGTQPGTPNKRKRSPASCRRRSLEHCRVRS